MRSYYSLAAVAADFGGTTDAYQAAAVWFAQTPQPSSINVGAWAKTATYGQLFGAPLTPANQLASAWTGITTGSFQIPVDGAAPASVTGLNFSAVSNMNGVAAVIDAKLSGATVTWNANYQQFVVTSHTTGASSAIGFASAAGSGVDVSALLGLQAASAGAYLVPGIAAESALAAVQIADNLFSTQWYGLVVPAGADSDHLAVATYIEAAVSPHYYGVTTSAAASLLPTDTTSLAYQLKGLGLNRTAVQYSSSNAYAIVSYLGRILTTNWYALNSAISLMYKQEPLVTAEALSVSQAAALQSTNCNVYVGYNNGVPIVQYGSSASGQWSDTIIGLDWLVADMRTRIFNLQYSGTTTKIPQTDAGNHQIKTEIEASLQAAAVNGLLGPGNWNNAGFGNIQSGSFLSKGFYVYQPPIASQSAADRAARKSVQFQIAAHLAGAVNTVNVAINVG
jgi:hypothetical protein